MQREHVLSENARLAESSCFETAKFVPTIDDFTASMQISCLTSLAVALRVKLDCTVIERIFRAGGSGEELAFVAISCRRFFLFAGCFSDFERTVTAEASHVR
jgi:hypothetical protein